MQSIGVSALRALRLSRGLSLADLTTASGLSPTTVGFIERGATPTPEQLVKLAAGLGIDPGTLAVTLATGHLHHADLGAAHRDGR